MTALCRWAAVGGLALFLAAPALAQENIDAGKSPAQLYAQDCAICHKTPHGLSKAGGAWGVQNFLREHYTASRETAAAIAGYLAAIDRGPAPRKRAVKRGPKNEVAKGREEKAKKAGEAKPAEPDDPKPSKPDDKAKADTKPDSKPAPADAKTDGAKASSDARPEKKPD